MTDRSPYSAGVSERSQHRRALHEAFTGNSTSPSQTSTAPPHHTPKPRQRLPHSRSDQSSPNLSAACVEVGKQRSRRSQGYTSSPQQSPSLSHSTSAGKHSGRQEEEDTTKHNYRPGEISQSREGRVSRRRKHLAAQSIDDPTSSHPRRTAIENATLSPRSNRQESDSSSRRKADRSIPSSNSPTVSTLSSLTAQTSASGGSNSTITQRSYDRNPLRRSEEHHSQRRSRSDQVPQQVGDPLTLVHGKRRPRRTSRQIETSSPAAMSDLDMPQGETKRHRTRPSARFPPPQNRSPSSSSASRSSPAPEHDEELSSDDDGGSEHESPLTSPASTRTQAGAYQQKRYNRPATYTVHELEPDVAVSEQGNLHAHVDEDDEDEEDEDEEVSDEDEESGESEEEGSEHHDQDQDQDYSDADDGPYDERMALERIDPARYPAEAAPQYHDPHIRRLKDQERQLKDHVLQSPQPHRDFRFSGGPSPQAPHHMPLYDPYAYPTALPVDGNGPMPQAPFWSPPPLPPPPIGYASPMHAPVAPYSPGRDEHMAMTTRPPMNVTGNPAQPSQYQMQQQAPSISWDTTAGYELVAEKLATTPKEGDAGKRRSIVPMYRKFEQLNHRVLLHLQDEIAELEEELRYLDESIAQNSQRDEVGRFQPASRRLEARHGTDLQFKRTEVLGKVYLKLGQYNQALSSYNTMVGQFDKAKDEDIQAYRTWMERRTPIDAAEARFLDRKNDLIAVSRKSAATVGGVSQHQSVAIYLPLILVFPLMAFAIVPGVLGRLFIIGLVGAAEVKIIRSSELEELMTHREWMICGSIYFGVMAVVAGLVR